MIPGLVLKGLRRGKARFICAASGVAVAAGAVVFMFSLAATNSAQAPALAERAAAPWSAWRIECAAARRCKSPDLRLPLVAMTIDYRPGGRVLQGPPMRASVAPAPAESPYAIAPLEEGRWVDASSTEPEVVCTRNTLRRFGRGEGAKIGETVKFVGRAGTMSARLVGYLAEARLPRGFPDTFANGAAFALLDGERHGAMEFWREKPEGDDVLTPQSPAVVAAFKGDDQRKMDYACPLMLIAAVLTALSLLVNSLLLSVEANRPQFAILRTVGMTRLGVVGFVATESMLSVLVGLAAGLAVSTVVLRLYVAADPVAFPVGPTMDLRAMAVSSVLALAVALLAVLFALRPALSVRPMDARSLAPRRRRHGMAVAFALGFGAFVAVEVWGASLMRGFVPSPEWPDAIVSLLPSGASSFDVERLRGLKGVRRISELYPLQLDLPSSGNALMLAAEWLPDFRFVEGDHDSCAKAMAAGDACVISLMISNSRNLHKGDMLEVLVGGGRGEAPTSVRLPIAGVADVNWHMVTSRGLVRGLNGASPVTDGPVFVSLDTIESLDPRPSPMVRMTHLWVEYEPDFLAGHGAFRAGRIVEREITDALGDPAELTVRLHARDEIADGTLAHGTDLIGQAARVPFVFLAILAMGFVAMLVAEADATRREYEVLRAIGATRMQLTLRMASVALKTAAIGIVAGLPPGAFAGWCFAMGTASVWPGMPHYFVVPLRVVVEGAAGAIAFAMAIALPAAHRLVVCGGGWTSGAQDGIITS